MGAKANNHGPLVVDPEKITVFGSVCRIGCIPFAAAVTLARGLFSRGAEAREAALARRGFLNAQAMLEPTLTLKHQGLGG